MMTGNADAETQQDLSRRVQRDRQAFVFMVAGEKVMILAKYDLGEAEVEGAEAATLSGAHLSGSSRNCGVVGGRQKNCTK
jgi:hypothetical protein